MGGAPAAGDAGGRPRDLLDRIVGLVRNPRAAAEAVAARVTPFRIGVVVIVVAVFALRMWSVSRSSWMADDWVYMDRARSMPFFDFLFQNYNGHAMPGEFVLVWLFTTVAPLSHPAAVWLTALGATAATLVWAVALRELCGERRRTLVPLALLSLTPLQIQSTIWWAAALQTISAQAALGGCVYFATRLARKGARRDRIGLLLTFAVGLVMWEKVLLLLIPIAALILYLSPRDVPGRWRRIAREGTWLGAVAAAYAVLFVAVTRQPSTVPGSTELTWQPLGTIAQWMGYLVGDLLGPGLLGGPWGTLPTDTAVQSSPAIWQIVLTTAVLAGGMLVALVLCRSAWLPIAMVVGFGLISWGLVVLTRLNILGVTKVGYERYAIDIFWVLCLAVAMYLAPEAARRHGRARRRARMPQRASGTTLAMAVVLGLVVSLSVANVVAVDRLGVSKPNPWVRSVLAEVDQRAPVTVVDGYAPDSVLFQPFWGERARLSNMLSPLGDKIRFNEPADRLYIITELGQFFPAKVNPAISSRKGPVHDCGYALAPGDTVTVPMTGKLYDYRWGLEVNGYTSEPGGLDVEIAGQTVPFVIRPGLNAPQAVVVGSVDRIRLTSTGESGVICVTDVVVGSLDKSAT